MLFLKSQRSVKENVLEQAESSGITEAADFKAAPARRVPWRLVLKRTFHSRPRL